jgi:hypothetical protein
MLAACASMHERALPRCKGPSARAWNHRFYLGLLA